MPTYEWNASIDRTIVNMILLGPSDPIPSTIENGTVIVRKQSDNQGEVPATITVWNS